MLILTRSRRESIVVDYGGKEITISVLEVTGQRVKLGIVGPPEVVVNRFEVQRRRREERGRGGTLG